jgi:hypothetical protein
MKNSSRFSLSAKNLSWKVITFQILAWIGLGSIFTWSFLAVHLSDLSAVPGTAARLGVLLGAGLCLAQPSWRRRAGLTLCVFGVILSWWLSLSPSNERDWQPDVRILPWAEIGTDHVTIHNIRDCLYLTETDYTVRHYSKTLNLADLRGVDLFMVYWGSPYIAHTMLSFDFGDGRPVCFSIEARKSVDESYSAVRGFFRQFELTYVVGDERDLVRLRTNFRNEDVYLYHLAFNYDVARAVFLEYLQRINQLHATPEWYNALLANCTTDIRRLARLHTHDARMDWRLIVNGFADAMAYDRGMLYTGLPFADLKAMSRVNDQARAVQDVDDFSRRIREHLPRPDSSRDDK